MFSASFLECGHETVYSFVSAVFVSENLDRFFHFCPECLVGHGQRPMGPQRLLIERVTEEGLLLNGFVHWFCRISTTESTSPSSLRIRDGCKLAWPTQELCSSIISRRFFRNMLQ